MLKKIKWKLFFKYLGFAAIGTAGILGAVVGVIAIMGKFKPVIIEPTSISFDIDNNLYAGRDISSNPVFVITEDSEFKVLTEPDDANQNDATIEIKNGSVLVKQLLVKQLVEPTEVEGEQQNNVPQYEYVEAETVEGKDNCYKINLNDSFKLVLSENKNDYLDRLVSLYVEHDTTFCEAKVFVDTVVSDYKLKIVNRNEDAQSQNLIFPGDTLEVSIDESTLTPSVSLTTSAICQFTNKYKYFTFATSDKEIAEVINIEYIGLKPKAIVKVNREGDFTITGELCRSYNEGKNILTEEPLTIEERQAYHDYLYGKEATVDSEAVEGILVVRSEELKAEGLTIESISSTKDIQTLNLFKSKDFTVSDLDIKIHPADLPGTSYTDDNLKDRISDVKIEGGYFVSYTTDKEVMYNNEKRYIEVNNERYIHVDKSVDAKNEPYWTVTVNDYMSKNEPSSCLYISYEIEETLETGGTVKRTISTFVPATIVKPIDPQIKEYIGDKKSSFDLLFDSSKQVQDTFSLDDIKVVMQNNETVELKNTDNLYKKVIFVTEDGNGGYAFENDIIKIYNEDFNVNGYNYIEPVGKTGTAFVYAMILKTNKDGKIVDKDNKVIENLSLASLKDLTDLRIYLTDAKNSLQVNVYEKLSFLETGKLVEIYDKDLNLINPEKYDAQVDLNGIITSLNMFVDETLYLKLNYNTASAFINAIGGTLKFEVNSNLISIVNNTTGDTDFGSNYFVNDGKVYIPVNADKALKTDSYDILNIKYNNDIIYSLTVNVKEYLLEELELKTNGTDSSTDKVNTTVKLMLESNSPLNAWSVKDDLITNLVLTSSYYPLQALCGEMNYAIYTASDEDCDWFYDHQNDYYKTQDWKLKVNQIQDIFEITGEANGQKENETILEYLINKAGKVIIIASSQDINGDQVYSNALVINFKYPNFEQAEFNYGSNTSIGDDNETYRNLYTSYGLGDDFDNGDYQTTDLLKYIGTELNDCGDSQVKIGLNYQDGEEGDFYSVNENLFKFEIVECSENNYESFVKIDGYHLLTKRVYNDIQLKIKVSTVFGYEFKDNAGNDIYFNYMLKSDCYSVLSDSTIEINNKGNSGKYLFKLKFENEEFVNDGGIFFITNDYVNSNYRLPEVGFTESSKITGSNGEIIRKIYLPIDFDFSKITGIDESKLVQVGDSDCFRYTTNSYTYEFERSLSIEANKPIPSLLSNFISNYDYEIIVGNGIRLETDQDSYLAEVGIKIDSKEISKLMILVKKAKEN